MLNTSHHDDNDKKQKKVWLFLHLARGVEDWSRFTDGSTRLATTLCAAGKTSTNRAEDGGSPQGWTHASARVGNCVRLNLPSSPALMGYLHTSTSYKSTDTHTHTHAHMVFGTAPDALPKHSVHGEEASKHLPNQKSF